MVQLRLLRASVFAVATGIAAASGAWAQTLSGVWDATVPVGGVDIPFRMGFSTDGGKAQGWFFNGDEKVLSSSGTFANGSLVLNFGSYAAVLRADLKNGRLEGEYKSSRRTLPFHAVPAAPPPQMSGVPDVGGRWVVEGVSSSRGEKAWDLVLRQSGAELSGAILRVDGDTGTLAGSYKDGKFALGHFDGARPLLLYVAPQSDGTLKLTFASQRNAPTAVAYRESVARANGMPLPVNADAYTGVKDASKPFPFRFPDLNGNMVSSSDARFRNKVVLISITGSWCPNCHDEAPFLVEIYKKYHDRGLEIVGLAFEDADQMKDPAGLRAFIAQYSIQYPMLLAGQTDTAKETLSAAANWDAFPTTFFVGRDGLVKYVHAGYAGAGTGELAKREKQEFTERVEKLLADQTSQR